MEVRCPQCKCIYYETTDTYDPDKALNGSMLQLLDPWKSYGWMTYGHYNGHSSQVASNMECCGCESPLAPSGRLTFVTLRENLNECNQEVKSEKVITEDVTQEFICDVCNKKCKSKAGLGAHKRVHK